MIIGKTTKIIASAGGFFIGGTLAANTANTIYTNNRDTTAQSTVLFDGFESVPISILAFIAGGALCVIALLFILKKISKHS